MEARNRYISIGTSMTILKLPFVFLLIWLLCLSGRAASQEKGWLSYERNIVQLQGKLTKVLKYGPPTYGENPETDARLEVQVLVLSQPVRVEGDSSSQINRESITNVIEIQLSFPQNVESNYWQYLNQEVRVTGVLFRRITGHHFTDVVMTVETIGPNR